MANADELAPCTQVVLDGTAHHDGKRAAIIGYDAGKQRYIVEFSSGGKLCIKRENLALYVEKDMVTSEHAAAAQSLSKTDTIINSMSEVDNIDCKKGQIKVRNVKEYLEHLTTIPQPTQSNSSETEAAHDDAREVQVRKRARESPLLSGFKGAIMRMHERGMRSKEIAQILALAEDDVVAVLVNSEVAQKTTESSASASQVIEGDPEAEAALVQRLQSDPEQFQCPILFCLMGDPVVADDGYTYERDAIRAALQRRPSSPMTNSFIGGHLVQNRSLKFQIDEYKVQLVSEIVAVVPRLTNVNDASALLARAEEFVKPRLPERAAQREMIKLLLLRMQVLGERSPNVVRSLVQYLEDDDEDRDWTQVLASLEKVGLTDILPGMKECVIEKLLGVAAEHKRHADAIGTIGHELIQRHMTRVRVEGDAQNVEQLHHLCDLMVRLNKHDSSKWFEGTAAIISILFEKIVKEPAGGCARLLLRAGELMSDHERREAVLAKLSVSPLC